MKKHLKKHSLHLVHLLLIVLSTIELGNLYQAHKSDDHIQLKQAYTKILKEHESLQQQ